MNYGEILSKTWQIIWKHKVLWIFGIMAGCAGSGGGNSGGSNFSNSGSSSGTNPFGEVTSFFESLSDGQIALLVAGVILFILLLVILTTFISTVGRIGLIRGAARADRDEQAALSFGELFRGSLPYFWRVFLLSLLVGLAIAAVMIPVIFLGVMAAVLTAGIALICLIPLICLMAPVFWAISVVLGQATIAIVIEDLGIMDGLRRGWQVVRANPGPMAILFLILDLAIKGIVGFIVALPAIVAMMPLIFGMIGGEDAMIPALIITLVCCAAYFPVLLLLNGILQSYVGSAWTLTFLRLTSQPAPAPAAFMPEPDPFQ